MRCYECDNDICTCHGEPEREWVEITRGQIAQALLDSSNIIDLGFAIEAICKENNGYT